jgi:hypothetical protein
MFSAVSPPTAILGVVAELLFVLRLPSLAIV